MTKTGTLSFGVVGKLEWPSLTLLRSSASIWNHLPEDFSPREVGVGRLPQEREEIHGLIFSGLRGRFRCSPRSSDCTCYGDDPAQDQQPQTWNPQRFHESQPGA